MKKGSKKTVITLLKKNISKGQVIGYSIANLVGLSIILAGILFYCDSRNHQKTEDNFFSDDYMIISKKVSGLNLEPVAFSTEEIEDLSRQPWVKKIGSFTRAQYTVNASINMGGKGMSTYLFFESVPDDFFDKLPYEWGFHPNRKFVPIVLNKDYLALYNFGFAIPRGLPQLSEEMIGTVPLKLILRGENGQADIFDASVVGFSSRLNTIAVPQDFMEWANQRYATKEESDISRIIIKIDRLNPGDSQTYLSEHGYEIAGDKSSDSKMSEFMGLVSGITTFTGVLISLLALFILLLSISLLIQKSRPMLRNLILLGYKPAEPVRFYNIMIIELNALITACSIGIAFLCRLIWYKTLETLGLGNGNVLFMLGAALFYFLIISLVNLLVIRRHLSSIWNNE